MKVKQLQINRYFRMGVQIVIFLALAVSLFNLFQAISTTAVDKDVFNTRNYYSVMAIVSLILLISFTEFTIESPSQNNMDNIKNIRKKYGKRIADAIEIPSSKDRIQISTIKDLVKIAGELGRPILHVADGVNHWFFVLDGQTMYEFRLVESDIEA